eukprot:1705885-Pleurochrysis_carterae.AAC.1
MPRWPAVRADIWTNPDPNPDWGASDGYHDNVHGVSLSRALSNFGALSPAFSPAQLLSPLVIFQIFCSVLWLLDA